MNLRARQFAGEGKYLTLLGATYLGVGAMVGAGTLAGSAFWISVLLAGTPN